jgi:hypothetical protein
MKLTELRQIIKEEIQSALNEAKAMRPLDIAKFEQIMNKAIDPKTYANVPDMDGDSPFFSNPKDAKDWVTGVKILEPMVKKGFNDEFEKLDRNQQKEFNKKVVPLFQTFENYGMIEDLPLGRKWAKINDAFDVFTSVFGSTFILGGWDEEEGIEAWNLLAQAVNSFKL